MSQIDNFRIPRGGPNARREGLKSTKIPPDSRDDVPNGKARQLERLAEKLIRKDNNIGIVAFWQAIKSKIPIKIELARELYHRNREWILRNKKRVEDINQQKKELRAKKRFEAYLRQERKS